MKINLAGVQMGQKVRVVNIRGGLGIRQRLSCLGIHPGDYIMVTKSALMRGPILINIHGNQVALGRGIATKVVVETRI
jgi:ferrous iron transport protein A